MSFVKVKTKDGRLVTVHSSQLPSFPNQQANAGMTDDPIAAKIRARHQTPEHQAAMLELLQWMIQNPGKSPLDSLTRNERSKIIQTKTHS